MSNPSHVLLPKGALIEMNELGGHIKVTAVDPVSFEEVSIVGSPRATQSELEDLAVRKLIWKLEKKLKESVTTTKKTNSPSGWDMSGIPKKKGPPSGWDL
ncbi:MAG: hypothetical protein R3261_00760 [Alphaproteobacteria bacterium]|nr:hypothetical protein [Alphaproteobacteria bacterium]